MFFTSSDRRRLFLVGALSLVLLPVFWLVSRGGIAPFDGDLDDYQRYLLNEAKRSREEAALQEKRAA